MSKTLEQKIENEKAKAVAHIEELKVRVQDDERLIKELKEAHLDAVSSFKTDDAFAISEQIKTVERQIEQANKSIKILGNVEKNPAIKRIIKSDLQERLQRFSEFNKRVKEKEKKINKTRTELVNGLLELEGIYQETNALTNYIDRWKSYLDEESLAELGLPNHRLSITQFINVRETIHSLLVEQHHVYKIFG